MEIPGSVSKRLEHALEVHHSFTFCSICILICHLITFPYCCPWVCQESLVGRLQVPSKVPFCPSFAVWLFLLYPYFLFLQWSSMWAACHKHGFLPVPLTASGFSAHPTPWCRNLPIMSYRYALLNKLENLLISPVCSHFLCLWIIRSWSVLCSITTFIPGLCWLFKDISQSYWSY